MTMTVSPRPLLAAAIATVLAGCATTPLPEIARNPAPPPQPVIARGDGEALGGTPRADARLQEGTGRTIDETVAASPPPQLPEGGEATFNFEGESLHAVVKAILGDLLQQNYVIAPTVQGTVTLATPRPVSPAQALSLLEMVLGWNNARLVWSNGRYAILPADQAVAGNLSPRTGDTTDARGFELRAVPLQYVSATEMQKLLKPYVREGAIVQADNARNLLVLSGSRGELDNYLRTVRIFDVDWLKGMSVGVFPIQGSEPEKVITALEKVFGEESESPLAGMFRFLPVEGSNSIIVITPQPRYLREAQQWIERIDLAGEGARLFVYEVKYMKAADLATQLGTVFDASVSASSGGSADIAPGLTPVTLGDVSRAPAQISQPATPAPSAGAPKGDGESGIGISAIDESNALMVRASPAQWESIRRAIERLDVMPAQVHIEAQVLEVTLQGNLAYGVNWYFERAIGSNSPVFSFLRPGANGLGFSGGTIVPDSDGIRSVSATFASSDAAAVVSLLERESDVRILSTPSLFVRNNAQAALNVGQNLAVASTSFTPGTGTGTTNPGTNTISNVQYLTTGTSLKVKPRIGGDGMVFLEIEQEISSPSDTSGASGNPNVSTRTVKTEAMVRDGETVMLGGLISQTDSRSSSGAPGLSRLPVVGGLFGQQGRANARSEVLLLITPRVVRSSEGARTLTDDYIQRFQGMAPPAGAAAPER